MALKMYRKKTAPNKHFVLNIIYKYVANKLSGVDSLILLGQYPTKAINRVIKHISNKRNEVTGWEINDTTWEDYDFRAIERNSAKLHQKTGTDVTFINADVMFSNTKRFEDLDFCCTWKNHRTLRVSRHDVVDMMYERLHMQSVNFPNKINAMVGTVALRNGLGKKHTFKCLNYVLEALHWEIVSIDGKKNSYGTGKRITASKSVHKNGRTYYPYEHDVVIKPSYDNNAPSNWVKLRLFTYTDTTPMLTFCIMYRDNTFSVYNHLSHAIKRASR